MNALATPWMAYCGTSQKTLMGRTAPLGASSIPVAAATALRRRSTTAAAALDSMAMVMPTPVRWRWVMPLGWPVRRRSTRTRTRSYKVRVSSMATFSKMSMEAGGILKRGVMSRSMVRACWIAKLLLCDAEVTSRMPAAQMGSMRMIDLSSSTRCTVDSRHSFGLPDGCTSPSVTMAALSKNLLIGVEKAAGGGDAGVQLLVLVQETRFRHDGFPLLERCGGDLRQPDQWTPTRRNLDVHRVPGHERDRRREHNDSGDAKPPTPTNVLLDVHHGTHGRELRKLDAEEVEVEEAPLGLGAPRPAVRVQLELVGAERHDAGPRASRADGRAEQRQVEHGDLVRRRAVAQGGVRGARRRVQRGEHGGQCEEDHAEQVDEGAERDGPEAAGPGVGDEAADERGEAGRAIEVGDGVGGLHERQVQLQGEGDILDFHDNNGTRHVSLRAAFTDR
ncbi:hypothetical protein EJB05_35512, partial [Eragrostis curvula]